MSTRLQDLPWSPVGCPVAQRRIQQSQKIATRHGLCAQAGQMAGLLLAVYMPNAARQQEIDQVGQGQLAGIAGAAKHCFPEKETPQANTVQPACLLSVYPGFN